VVGEGRTKDRCEGPADVVAEGETELSGAMIRHEIALNSNVSTSDAEANCIQFLVVCRAPCVGVNSILGFSLLMC